MTGKLQHTCRLVSRSSFPLAVLLIAVLVPCLSSAQENEPLEGKLVRDIQIDIKLDSSMPPGTKITKEDRHAVARVLRAKMKTRVGNPYSADTLDKDIKRIIAEGRFWLRAKVLTSRDGATINLTAILRPVVKKIEFVDRKGERLKIPSNLQTDLISKADRYFSRHFLLHDRRAIEKHYRTEGYPFVRVESKAHYTALGVKVEFQVDLGTYVVLRCIEFEGNRFFTGQELYKKMQTPVQNWGRRWIFFIRDAKYNRESLEEDVRTILQVYQNEGFLDADVRLKSVKVSRKRHFAVARIAINEGPRYHVSEVNIKGNNVFGNKELVKKVKLKPGSPYRRELIDKDMDAISELYDQNGYLHSVKHEIAYGLRGTDVRLTYIVGEGPQIFIGKIRIEGNDRTRDNVIRRELSVHPGQKFSRREWRQSLQRVLNLQFFDSLELLDDSTDNPSVRDFTLKLNERKTGRLGFGFSYSTAVGLQGLFSLSQRNWDFTDLPKSLGDFVSGNAFVGGGTSLSLSFQPGKVDTRYSIDYRDPHFMDSDTRLSVGLQFIDSEYTRWDKRSEGIHLGLGRSFGRNISLDMIYRIEANTLTNISPSSPIDVFLSEGTRNLSAIKPVFSFSNVNTDIHTTRYTGCYAKVSYEYAGGFMGGEVDFSAASVALGGYKKVYEDKDGYKHVLSLELVGRWKEPHHNTRIIPWYERYFLGGPGSLRGFEWQSVGPKEGRDFIGGNVLMTANLEYSIPLFISKDLLRAAFFVDVGNLTEDVDSFKLADFRMSAGVSFRLRAGNMFVFNMDFGYPVKRFKGDERRTFHLTFGTEF